MKKILNAIFLCIVAQFTLFHIQAQSTFVSNLGLSSSGSMVVGSNSWLAASFFTGTNNGGYNLNSIQLRMSNASGIPRGFAVFVYGTVSNFPSINLGELSGISPDSGGIFTYTTSGVTLSSTSLYFLVLTADTDTAEGAFYWNFAGGPGFVASGGWSMAPYYHTSMNGMNWTRNGQEFQFAVSATPVPEPNPVWLIGFGWILIGLCSKRTSIRSSTQLK